MLPRSSAICTAATHRIDWGRAAGRACRTTKLPSSAGGIASTSHTGATGQASGPWPLAQHAGYIQTPHRRCNPHLHRQLVSRTHLVASAVIYTPVRHWLPVLSPASQSEAMRPTLPTYTGSLFQGLTLSQAPCEALVTCFIPSGQSEAMRPTLPTYTGSLFQGLTLSQAR